MAESWKVSGTYFEACNCAAACPCVFLSAPTEGTCVIIAAWHIDQGNFGAVQLNGLNVALRPGWEGRILRRHTETEQETTYSVVHLATFPLPEARGDFGAGVTELMRSPDVFVVLFEYGPESLGSPMFRAQGIPRLTADQFSSTRLHRPLPGQLGCQLFFTEGDRPFCLYVVAGNLIFLAGDERPGTVDLTPALFSLTALLAALAVRHGARTVRRPDNMRTRASAIRQMNVVNSATPRGVCEFGSVFIVIISVCPAWSF
jgi:hypothetical protein